MITYRTLVVVCVQLYLVITGAVIFALSEKETKEVTSINNISQRAAQVDLIGNSLHIATATTTSRAIEVHLSVAEKQCRIKESDGGKTEEKEMSLWCYELRANDEAIPYSRTLWTSRPVKGFRLCPGSKGKNYLAWVDGSSVRIEEVGQSKGMSEALTSYLLKSNRYIVPVTHLVGRTPFEGLDAIHSDIDIISVGEDEFGRLRLIVQAPKTAERFEFVFDGQNWAWIK